MVSVELDYSIIPLGRAAHQTAEQFAAQQATVSKGRQVYLNTLAVYAVHQYLTWRQVTTRLEQSDSWHPMLRSLFNTADLVLPDLGKLECRPILRGETAIKVPLEVTHDRIGYVAVKFAENLNQAQLLGFAPTAPTPPTDTVSVSTLHPLEELLDYLHQVAFRHQHYYQVSETLVDLRQWLQGIFAPDWQPVEAIAGLAFRSSPLTPCSIVGNSRISRVKRIDLGEIFPDRAIAQVMQMTPTAAGDTEICLCIFPLGEFTCLPPGLHLAILDASGDVFLQTTSKASDNWIQLNLTASPDEVFNVQLRLGDYSIDQPFIA